MKVLVVEDDPITNHLLQALLVKAAYQPLSVADGAEALDVLDKPDCPRLVILDWMIPNVNGLEICRIIRKKATESYTYVILLTAKGTQEEILEGLEAGADDYITKPFDFHELVARLRAGRRILELQEQLVTQATHDSLTGLLNREAILSVLRKETRRALRNKSELSIIMADIDHFKRVNDTHGHMTGDIVLREIGKKIPALLRSYDSVGRYGGEEFLIIAPGCSLAEAANLAERVRTFVTETAIVAPGCELPITLSFGVADTSVGQEPEDMLRAADATLYVAKKGGRNRVEMCSEVKASI